MRRVICSYCGKQAELITNEFGTKLWRCRGFPECDARVTAHQKSGAPMGYLANAELRALRKNIHELMDPLWRVHKVCSRSNTYILISKVLGVPKKKAHVARLSHEECLKLFDFLSQLEKDHKSNRKKWVATLSLYLKEGT